MTGNEILARCLKDHGVDVIFFLMGGPMIDCENACHQHEIRMIDVRHEQAAAMMANAFSRLRRRPAVCMACSGPGATNLVTGIANAHVDSAPVVAIAGSSPVSQSGMGAFQETDQVGVFRPITRWAERCYDARRIPEYVAAAFRHAFGSRPGPVYLDMPGDVLYREVADDQVRWVAGVDGAAARPQGDAALIGRAVDLIANSTRPVIISGSGVLWAGAERELQTLVERARIPFYTTPQGRGVIPEDHPLCFLGARGTAWRDADLVAVVGTRQNYVVGFARPPRVNPSAKLLQIDVDPAEIGRNRHADCGIAGDAKAVLAQVLAAGDGRFHEERRGAWISRLAGEDETKRAELERQMSAGGRPIHPLRLCREIRDFLPRDAVLCVDGQEILNYARSAIPFYAPHSLNSGPYGCMGVGLPFGLGAKAAMPDKLVVVLHGDGSFGLNAMELDTALRHRLPVVCVVSNNGGWTATDRFKIGRDLGFTRYDLMFGAIGCHAEYVEDPDLIRPALERAAASGRPAVVNVRTDPAARAQTQRYADYST
ncbi:MAG TPA: thiamine pyrophosphate-binding protein [bacterium]|nr:thiamine pyrophosphate-binding protein [bacterium]